MAPTQLEQGSILVIVTDDDDSSRERLVNAIKPVSSLITEARTGEETLHYLAINNYDCLILDYILPDFDGLALVHEIRLRGIGVPIVVITGNGDEMLAVKILHAGAQDYIPKSKVTPDILQRSVLNAIRLKASADKIEYYKDFYDTAPVGFYTTDLKTGKFLKANSFFIDMLGCVSLKELRDKYVTTDFYEPSRRRELLRLLSMNGCVTDFEIELSIPGGDKRWAILTARPCRHGGCLEGSITDITERKKLEAELRNIQVKEMQTLRDIQSAIQDRLQCA